MRIKKYTILVIGFFPSSKIKNFLLRLLGWKIGSGVKIGINCFVNTKNVRIANNAHIRPLNVFRNVELEFRESSILGSFNWISAAKGLENLPNYRGKLFLGKESAINSRNYFDVSGGINIGDFSDIAGVRSTFITHQIDLKNAIQTCDAIEIGKYTMICSNSLLVPGGTYIGDRCLFAMGSTITAGTYSDGGFYAGVPAILKKGTDGKWFNRSTGKVQ